MTNARNHSLTPKIGPYVDDVHVDDRVMAVETAHEIDPQPAGVAWAAMAPLAGVTASLGVFGLGPSGQLGDHATTLERHLDVTGWTY